MASAGLSGDMSEDDNGPPSASDWHLPDSFSPADSVKSDSEVDEKSADDPNASSQPIQKRRRVTRACDECRRKKIKCDGKQPCTHCSVYSYECTYDKPSNRRRNPAPQYIEALESRLQRAEALLRKFVPDVDLADPTLDPAIQQEFLNREQARATALKMRSVQAGSQNAQDAKLTTMINSIGQLDLDDEGGWDFHGTSSGAVFLRRMKEHFRGLLGPMTKAPFLPRPERLPDLIALDSPAANGPYPFSTIPSVPDLPTKDVARSLCHYSLSCATCLARIVHVPSFYNQFDRVYGLPLESLNLEDTHFLGLVYAVVALGCMYSTLETDQTVKSRNYKEAMGEGLKYYKAARALLQDLAECRDIVSLQALLFMIFFLQSTSNLSACYTFVGLALRSALRIGLHRHLQHEKIGTIEQEVRRRLFYVIRQMDIYVSTMLGFPLLLNSEDVDQAYPSEVNDEFISDAGIIMPPPGTSSFFEAFNAQTRLMEILSKITKYVYPMHRQGRLLPRGGNEVPTYAISYARIKEIETDLQGWYERLPEVWRPSPEGPIEVVRVRHLLRFAYAHVQLVLYRPFLHYISPRLNQSNKVDELSYACAAAAISVSRNIVHIGLEIRKQRVLSGQYWFILYTEFFAVLSLVFYALENPDKPGSQEVLADARAGWRMIADLADKSMSADRVTKTLNPLFEQLPERLDQTFVRPMPTRKRSAVAAKSGLNGPHHARLTPSLSVPGGSDFTRHRAAGGSVSSGSFGPVSASEPMDSIAMTPEQIFNDSSFTSTLRDMIPMDLSSRATPDSSSTGSTQRQQFSSQVLSAHGAHNPVNQLDSVMFPSEDPFAYPNQPMMELGFQSKADGYSVPMGTPATDFSLFLPGSLDELGDQLFGQPPPYMIQQQQRQQQPPQLPAQQQHRSQPQQQQQQQQHQQQQQQQQFALSGGAYDPHNMLAMHTAQHQQPQRSTASQHGSGGFFSGFRRARADRQQERQIEQMFMQQGMQPDWGSFFGSGRGGFQGM